MGKSLQVLNDEDKLENGRRVLFYLKDKVKFGTVCGMFHRGPAMYYIVKTDRQVDLSYEYDCVVVWASAVTPIDEVTLEITGTEINGG
jgi:hypothetical protein